ncbi:MAG: tRNA (adenosine(37)-N6)-threonylcarbamoyltransferase complex dimerization subunit type 1 TsaB, partial [Chloroflexi bacterium]|nr:tRNA (adenosine(37)-N6)-threonylcarbamoyltransferase complex dimerization subunit type 1 TsaB [Chloroflexota bacterium]
RQNHAVELLPNIDHLLAKTDRSKIKGIIVAIGPGSFNGLRVGLSTAKGLALSFNAPLVGISTLQVEAYRHALHSKPICPIFNAGRSEIATALFQSKDGKWQKLTGEHITTIDELCSKLKNKTIFCGQITEEIASQLKSNLGDKAIVAQGALLMRRAGYLAELGWKRLTNGEADDAATLQPLYLKKPAITKPKQK